MAEPDLMLTTLFQTEQQFIVYLTNTIHLLDFKEALDEWARKGERHLGENIQDVIAPQLKEVEKYADYAQNYIKDQCKDTNQNTIPSFNEAITALEGISQHPHVHSFFQVGKNLQALVKHLSKVDAFLGNFECFKATRTRYSTDLTEMRRLVFEDVNNTEMHESFEENSLDRAYALLFSVAPRAIEIIERITRIICSEISTGDALVQVSQEEINKWLVRTKEANRRNIDTNVGPQLQHTYFYIDGLYDHLIIENGRLRGLLEAKTKEFDEETKEKKKQQQQLHEKTKEFDEQTKEMKKLQQQLNEKTKEFNEQTKEMKKLQQLLDEKTKENKQPQIQISECRIADSEDGTHAKSKAEIPEDEFNKLLRESQKRAKQDPGMNFSTSNFAYGLFDSSGGKLSIEKAGVELFIPAGAISSPQQEIYVYIDPKARFSKAVQAKSPKGKEQRKTRVAPIVYCGPQGITFLDHVVLTIPHNADNENKWEFTPVRSEGDRHSDDWQNIGTDTNGGDDIVFVNGGFCVFMVKHFTSFTLMKDLD